MSLMMIVIWCVVLLACVGAILWAYMNVRARRIVSRLGAFRCWSRPDVHAGWTAGIGVYGVEELSWYRLVGLGFKPVYSIPRRGMEVSLRLRTRLTVQWSRRAWRMVSIVTRLPWNA